MGGKNALEKQRHCCSPANIFVIIFACKVRIFPIFTYQSAHGQYAKMRRQKTEAVRRNIPFSWQRN